MWNRYGKYDDAARRFEAAGARVLVAENAYVPVKGWYALALGHHAGRGRWSVGGPERWVSFGIELQPWHYPWGETVILSQHARLKDRPHKHETVILGQRSIGERGIASPRGWEQSIQRKIGGRIRLHPGKHGTAPPLERDLADAFCAVTWASSAALRALTMGVPCFYGLGGWIGAAACRPLERFADGPLRDDAARLAMFERLAWAQAPLDEIRSGEAIVRLLEHA